jgi:hypothetical protein
LIGFTAIYLRRIVRTANENTGRAGKKIGQFVEQNRQCTEASSKPSTSWHYDDLAFIRFDINRTAVYFVVSAGNANRPFACGGNGDVERLMIRATNTNRRGGGFNFVVLLMATADFTGDCAEAAFYQ